MKTAEKQELVKVDPQRDTSLTGFQDLFSPPKLSKPEMHLLLKPFFLLDRHADRFKPIDHVITQMIDGKAITRRWFVQPHALYGLPGAFDRDVTIALYEIVNEKYFSRNLPVPEVMPIGSITAFIQRMGLTVCGTNITAVKDSFKRLQNTLCTADETFFDNKRKRYVSLRFGLLRGVGFSGEDDGNGGKHEENFVLFDEALLRNLNSGYVMVIDVESFRRLKKDTAKQLYSHLAYRFYLAAEDGADHWVADYHWLAVHLGIKRWHELWRAKQQLQDAHEELKNLGYISDFRWDGWRVLYRPGVMWQGEQMRRKSGKARHKATKAIKTIKPVDVAPPVPREPHDVLIPALAAFAGGLSLGEERIKALGLTSEQAIALCLEKGIQISQK